MDISGFSPNLVCAFLLLKSGSGLLMSKFRKCLTESARDTSIFSFQDNSLRKSQWIFSQFDIALILCRSGLGLLLGIFHQFLIELSPHDTVMVGYYCFMFLFYIM